MAVFYNGSEGKEQNLFPTHAWYKREADRHQKLSLGVHGLWYPAVQSKEDLIIVYYTTYMCNCMCVHTVLIPDVYHCLQRPGFLCLSLVAWGFAPLCSESKRQVLGLAKWLCCAHANFGIKTSSNFHDFLSFVLKVLYWPAGNVWGMEDECSLDQFLCLMALNCEGRLSHASGPLLL